MNRTYLIVGGDEYERGEVAGNVARAVGTAYRQVRLNEGAPSGHRCAALNSVKQALSAVDPVRAVVLFDGAGMLFEGTSGDASCPGCNESEEADLGEFLHKTGGTFLFAVATPPADTARGGWRPDVVVYLSRVGPRMANNPRAAVPHVRVGSTGFRSGAGHA